MLEVALLYDEQPKARRVRAKTCPCKTGLTAFDALTAARS
jgi:hypothetical protein